MARKDLLKGLMDAPAPQAGTREAASGRRDPAPRAAGGAIGAVSRSVADLKSRAVIEVDARMIDGAGIADRMDEDADLDRLAESIREYGQQVPVLLRVNPNDPERWEVVYGRRRVAALKRLGQPVRALVRDLNDRALVIAQGQENAHRKDLTFIERANFARQMVDAGYDRTTIGAALAVDKTVISRMLNVMDRVPLQVVHAIGAAPSFGRDRWIRLADAIGDRGADAVAALAEGDTSDDRFSAVMAGLARPRRQADPRRVVSGPGGRIATVQVEGGRARLTVEDARFGDWLAGRLERLHDEWVAARE
ncbi:plasmid partitioning protein RepB [Jannaschia sp. LMIT008]|uniref:plasmid partitioning protein RepB n=1 Tax=Jannaschia maritima TaxID=3032585 RepID=UPI002810DAA0|nr:plasmid partitioning protein RepB [Jannaschia sp. LMIT008]